MKRFCDLCGDRLFRFGFKYPNKEDPEKMDIICNRCLVTKFKVEFDENGNIKDDNEKEEENKNEREED